MTSARGERAARARGGVLGQDRTLGDSVDSTAAQAALSTSYLLYMAASGVLASVALLSNSVPILIGSMIVAPLMPPIALVAFALVAGRRGQAGQAFGVALAGLAVAFAAAWTTTALMDAVGVLASDVVLLNRPLLEERVRPGWWSMAAAIAAGVAGALAQAHDKTDTLVGTVAALALVPAVGASAIAVYVGATSPAIGGLVLLVLNVGLMVATGVTVMLTATGRAGVRPLALMPVLTVVAVALLLSWAQANDTVPERPASFDSSTGSLVDAPSPLLERGQQPAGR